MTIEIKMIEIDIDGVILKLTPEQAQNLKIKLNELMPNPTYIPYYQQPGHPWYGTYITCTDDKITWTS